MFFMLVGCTRACYLLLKFSFLVSLKNYHVDQLFAFPPVIFPTQLLNWVVFHCGFQQNSLVLYII